jgi:hypothetical protein
MNRESNVCAHEESEQQGLCILPLLRPKCTRTPSYGCNDKCSRIAIHASIALCSNSFRNLSTKPSGSCPGRPKVTRPKELSRSALFCQVVQVPQTMMAKAYISRSTGSLASQLLLLSSLRSQSTPARRQCSRSSSQYKFNPADS